MVNGPTQRASARHRYSAWTLGSDIWSLGRIPLVRSLLGRVLRDAEHCGLMSEMRDDTQAIAGGPSISSSTRRIDRVRPEALRSRPPYDCCSLALAQNKGIDLLLEALAMLSTRTGLNRAYYHRSVGPWSPWSDRICRVAGGRKAGEVRVTWC